MRRYHLRAEMVIDAPPSHVYAVASDPARVPEYADEIVRIDVLNRPTPTTAHVASHLRIGPIVFRYRYRYRYVAGRFYGGVQEGSRIYRGYFGFIFTSRTTTSARASRITRASTASCRGCRACWECCTSASSRAAH